MANALNNSPISSLVEMVRVAALGGGRVGRRRFKDAHAKLGQLQYLAGGTLSGMGSSSGSMRVEGSYAFGNKGDFGEAIVAASLDMLYHVVGMGLDGWGDLRDLFYAIPADLVSLLVWAVQERALGSIEIGFDAAGDTSVQALPVGLVPTLGELSLQLEGKVFQRVVVGRMLLKGLKHFGFTGKRLLGGVSSRYSVSVRSSKPSRFSVNIEYRHVGSCILPLSIVMQPSWRRI